jgi:1-deoxy-D-xylulose-5-phosphate reductoisomerase
VTKGIAVLGSTGSIGVSTLDVVAKLPDRFRIVALAAGRNVGLLAEQIRRHRPHFVSVRSAADADRLRDLFPIEPKVGWGAAGLVEAATLPEADIVVGGIVGAAGLPSAHAALVAGKTLALANKETLVVAGDAMKKAAALSGATILPVDSEHNAVHQALRTGSHGEVLRIILTASGGPFRNRPLETFDRITIGDALAHPTWKMGPKISIDSATMMNKGLEIIEAHHLFDLPAERIDAVIHPQSVVHSMVEWVDGSVVAQLSINDMRFPILYALCWPERLPTPFGRLDWTRERSLEFFPLDPMRYPAVPLAREALARGGSFPAVLNGANEAAVAAFLEGRIPFLAITSTVRDILSLHAGNPGRADTVEEALHWDDWARSRTDERIPRPAPSYSLF